MVGIVFKIIARIKFDFELSDGITVYDFFIHEVNEDSLQKIDLFQEGITSTLKVSKFDKGDIKWQFINRTWCNVLGKSFFSMY